MDAETVIEDVVELVENTTELVSERVSWIVKNPKTVLLATTVVAISVGLGAGYFIATHRLRLKYQELADAQVKDVKEHYAILNKDGDHGDLDKLAAQYDHERVDDIIDGQGYLQYDKVEPSEEQEAPKNIIARVTGIATTEEGLQITTEYVEKNIFESDDPETYFDFEEELERRLKNPTSPYVITKEEFDECESEYEQITLTYFDGDDVLSDSRDQTVNDIANTIGYENLLRFGHGSNDKNVVYIRNARLELEMEVLKSEGKYAQEVLGYIEHSHKRPLRKFRSTDE